MRIVTKARIIGMLATIVAVGAILAVGCGGGGDKIDFSGGKDTSNSATQDSGDNGSDSENSDSGGSSKDADSYASKVCSAIGKYADDIEKMSNSDASFEDPEAMKDMMDQAVPVLEGIAKDLDKIDPPSEVKDWHNGMVSTMSMAAELFDKMAGALDKPMDEAMAEITDLSSQMSDTQDPFAAMGDLPQEYQTAFENNADCQDLQNMDIFQ